MSALLREEGWPPHHLHAEELRQDVLAIGRQGSAARHVGEHGSGHALQHLECGFNVVNLGTVEAGAAVIARTSSSVLDIELDTIPTPGNVHGHLVIHSEVALIRRGYDVPLFDHEIAAAVQDIARLVCGRTVRLSPEQLTFSLFAVHGGIVSTRLLPSRFSAAAGRTRRRAAP
jgi:hypothetical protein